VTPIFSSRTRLQTHGRSERGVDHAERCRKVQQHTHGTRNSTNTQFGAPAVAPGVAARLGKRPSKELRTAPRRLARLTARRRGPTLFCTVDRAGSRFRHSQRTADRIPSVARTPFSTPDALIVVSSDGYFDVFRPAPRRPNDKPAYRGVLAELGPTVRGHDDRLSVRPDSPILESAVSVWAASHGAAAVKGELGLGRNGVQS